MSYSAHGGPGYILSAGLLGKVSQADIEHCVASGDPPPPLPSDWTESNPACACSCSPPRAPTMDIVLISGETNQNSMKR